MGQAPCPEALGEGETGDGASGGGPQEPSPFRVSLEQTAQSCARS